jgi:hypothetical protein
VLARLDTPWVPAVALLAFAAVLVVARFADAASHGGVSDFIVVGSRYVSTHRLPGGVHPTRVTGYDGQFFYRLALAPNHLSRTAFGLTLDTPYRLQRIGYPALAWAAAGGHRGLVPWSLIGVNVTALGAVGFFGGAMARDSGRHALWGLFIAGYWGYAFSLSRDLAEIVAAAFVLAGLLALRRNRPVLTGVLLAAAVLTRETAGVVVAAIAVTALVEGVRAWSRGSRPGLRAQVAWLLPALVFAGWQLTIRLAFGQVAATADTAANLSKPFVAMDKAIVAAFTHLGPGVPYAATEILVLVVITALAAWAWPRTKAPMAERVAWLGTLALVVCLSSAVWGGTAHFRSLDQLYLLGTLLIVGSRARLYLPAALVALLGVLVGIHQIRAV